MVPGNNIRGLRTKLKRHPFSVCAEFDHCLVLTYAFPENLLKPLLPPGLHLDTYSGLGFVAVAMVQTRNLRPQGFPRFTGHDFFLSGYRIFTRFTTAEGRTLRGLKILRSDTDNRAMAFFGNILTHYNYQLAKVELKADADRLTLQVTTPKAVADLELTCFMQEKQLMPPNDSPFHDLRQARLYAGPLPYTFDYEAETNSIVRIEGVRPSWTPKPVRVEVKHATFFRQAPFSSVEPILANAFYVKNIHYSWRKGVVEKLEPK